MPCTAPGHVGSPSGICRQRVEDQPRLIVSDPQAVPCVRGEPQFGVAGPPAFGRPAKGKRSELSSFGHSHPPVTNLSHLSFSVVFSYSSYNSKSCAPKVLPQSSSGSFLRNKFLTYVDLSLVSSILQSMGAWRAPQRMYRLILTNGETTKEKSLFSTM